MNHKRLLATSSMLIWGDLILLLILLVITSRPAMCDDDFTKPHWVHVVDAETAEKYGVKDPVWVSLGDSAIMVNSMKVTDVLLPLQTDGLSTIGFITTSRVHIGLTVEKKVTQAEYDKAKNGAILMRSAWAKHLAQIGMREALNEGR